jgi:hypothetical protein
LTQKAQVRILGFFFDRQALIPELKAPEIPNLYTEIAIPSDCSPTVSSDLIEADFIWAGTLKVYKYGRAVNIIYSS